METPEFSYQCDCCEEEFAPKDLSEDGYCFACLKARYTTSTFASNIDRVMLLRDYLFFHQSLNLGFKFLWEEVCALRDSMLEQNILVSAPEIIDQLIESADALVSFAQEVRMDAEVSKWYRG